jgi:hypothetical protein
MNTNDKKLFDISCREILLEIVKDSESINKQLTFTQKILLYDKITEMPLNEIVSLLFEGAREIETKDERDTKYGAATTAGGLTARFTKFGKAVFKQPQTGKLMMVGPMARGAAIGIGLMFLYRRLTDPCFKQTVHILNPSKRKIAKLNCENEAIKRVIGKIKSDMEKCQSAPNPDRCRDKITYEMNKWRTKYQENLAKITRSQGTEHGES